MLLLLVALVAPLALLFVMMLMERIETRLISLPEVDIERFVNRATPEEIEDYFQNGLHPSLVREWTVRR